MSDEDYVFPVCQRMKNEGPKIFSIGYASGPRFELKRTDF